MSSETQSRYIIGIDLGTTNSSLSYVDTHADEPKVQLLKIPQVIAPGEIEALDSLPSFLYLADENTTASGQVKMPWQEDSSFCAGLHARKIASAQPSRVASSAKSWLCAPGQDPTADYLPADEQAERKVSPVNALSAYLRHLSAAWNEQMDESIDSQDLILTVPASFNALARELTVLAAEEAGLNPILLEEPQAAFYSWIRENEGNWRELVEEDSNILVVDIGGGTTDFSLIGINNEDGNMNLQRAAVGNHLLLGGDNMDFTLAYAMQQKLRTRLNTRQFTSLVHICRQAKETLLSADAPEQVDITVLGAGSSLIGGTLKTALNQEEVDRYIFQGFLPECSLEDKAQNDARSGLRSFGLNFESDAAITRHLAEFITKNCPDKTPSTILFNGGVTRATQLRERLGNILASWSGKEISVLSGTDPDLAVASGAAWYGFVRRGNSIRIKAGSALSYYIGLESNMPAVPGFAPPVDAICVIPSGTEDGTSLAVPVEDLALLIGEDSQFRFFCSNDRKEDQLGSIVMDADLDLSELPALHKNLKVSDEQDSSSRLVPVELEAIFTEIGTVQVWGKEKQGEGKWRLEFDLQDGSGATE